MYYAVFLADFKVVSLKLKVANAFLCVHIRKKSANIKSAYKQDYFHGTGDVDFDFAGPTVQASAVVG